MIKIIKQFDFELLDRKEKSEVEKQFCDKLINKLPKKYLDTLSFFCKTYIF